MLAYISHKAGKPRVLNLHGATDVIVTSPKGSINPVPRELQIRNRPLLDMSQSNANQTIDKVAEQTKSFVSQAEEQGNKFFHDSKNYLLSEQAQKYAHDAYEQVSHAFQGTGADASNAGSQISK